MTSGGDVIQPRQSFKRVGTSQVKFAAVALGRPAATIIARRRWRAIIRRIGGKVVIERLRLGCRSAPGRQGEDAHHPHPPPLRKGQHITRPHGLCRFRHLAAVDAHMPARDHPRRQAARLEEPRLPEPLVQPGLLRRFAHQRQVLSLSPISAAAKGLSGSMRSFFSGRAE